MKEMNFTVKPNFEHFQAFGIGPWRFQRTKFKKWISDYDYCYVDEILTVLGNGIATVCYPFKNKMPISNWLGFQIVGGAKECVVSEAPIP